MEQIVKDKIELWLSNSYDAETRAELQSMIDEKKEDELTDAFYKDLEFGTGGLRGIMGVGSNRMNKYTVGAATQGLSNYLLKSFPNEEIKVAVAHDSRNNSSKFAKIVTDIFSANGIKVFFFKELRPTPELSFAIRYYGCKSGVVLTASHNPREYNGYKAYWDDGAQVLTPHDKNIINEVNAIENVSDIKFEGNNDLIVPVLEEIDAEYIKAVENVIINKDIIRKNSNVNIVYTPIHGTGITMVPRTLETLGFTNVNVVEEQSTPDGNFPTVVYPNPEEREAMSKALAMGQETNADLIMATDPDADRVGVGMKNHKGEYVLLNGNQTGAIIFYYILKAWEENNRFKGNEYIVSTIVTSPIMEKIAERFKVGFYKTLTGFKHIAKVIRDKEDVEKFVCGGEESYGYMLGDYARDKDGVASCAAVAEMTAWAAENNKSLFDVLMDIYMEIGFYKEHMTPLVRKGRSGAEEIAKMMVNFRNNPPKQIDGSTVHTIYDYQEQTILDVASGNVSKLEGFPVSNVLQYQTEDNAEISVRPSGTEPKIKFYISVNEAMNSRDEFDAIDARLGEKIDRICKELGI